MRKRIGAVLLAVCLVVGLLPTVAFAGGGPAVMVVCVYDETELPTGYTIKNPAALKYGLVQAFEQAREYEANYTRWCIVIESDENFGGDFCWPKNEAVNVSYLKGISKGSYEGTYLSGTWTIPANVTLDFNNNSSHDITPDDPSHYTDPLDPAEAARTPLPPKIDLSGAFKNLYRVESGFVLNGGAELAITNLVIPEDSELEVKGDVSLTTSVTLSKNASAIVNGTVTAKPSEDHSGGLIGSFDLKDGAQIKLENNSKINLTYPCIIDGSIIDPTIPDYAKPSRPLLAGSGTISLTYPDIPEGSTEPVYYRFLSTRVEQVAHNPELYKDQIEPTVKIEYNWDCENAHNWVDYSSLEPTCTYTGVSRKVCYGCWEVQETVTPALGHDLQLTDGVYKCQREGCAYQTEAEPVQLPEPTALTWDVYTPNQAAPQVQYPGALSWTVSESTTHPHQYEMKLYRGNEQILRSVQICPPNVDSFTFTYLALVGNLEFLQTGSYYFTVQALPYNCACTASEPVRSETWNYTRPEKQLTAPEGLTWEGRNAAWNAVAGDDVGGYGIQVYYSKTDANAASVDGLELIQSSLMIEWKETSHEIYESQFLAHGSGYYYFTVYSASANVKEVLHSNDSALSPAYHYEGGGTGTGTGTDPVNPNPGGNTPTPPSSGGGSSSGYYPSTGSGSTGTTTTTTTTANNPDGSTTTTVTNRSTGTVTETTRSTDGSTTVVETRTDGTVTTTQTASSGVKVTTVSAPGTDVTASITIPASAGSTAVTIPSSAVTPGTVAVDAKTGEIIKLSVPTENGLAVRLDGSADIILEDRSKNFADTGSHWAADSIDFVTAHGMFSGTSENSFSPEEPMTRAMMMTVLARFDGVDTSGGSTWYEKGMEWSRAAGVSDGNAPNQQVTREQLVTMLYRYAGNPAAAGTLAGFPDADRVSDYAEAAMRWAVETGLVMGSNGWLNPQGNATRAEVAAILSRFCTNLTI